MTSRSWRCGLMAGAFLMLGPFARGDNGPFSSNGVAGPPPQNWPQQQQPNWQPPQQNFSAPQPNLPPSQPNWPPQQFVPSPQNPPSLQQNWQPPQGYVPPAAPVRSDGPPAADHRPIQPFAAPSYQMPMPPVPGQAAPVAMPGQPLTAQPAQGVLLPPPVRPEGIPAGQPVNGTWRDEGDCVVIEVNGQQLRLAKPTPAQPQAGAAAAQIPTGSAHGRLFQGSRPLVNCTVVIVPMHNDGTNDDNGIRQPIKAVTDADGVYGFENVPAGPYKMTWLPAGTEQWIRRIEMKPDVFVHEGQDLTVKDIRWAQRTIN